ncbi:MAG: hypothetical protein WB586_17615 [Chthoniobacterales bacterium]
MLEIMVGMFGLAVVTGLIFVRFLVRALGQTFFEPTVLGDVNPKMRGVRPARSQGHRDYAPGDSRTGEALLSNLSRRLPVRGDICQKSDLLGQPQGS